jgi:hypothetical protein|tara:strand:- start:4376 stop:5146 length:771 start_codon:yes stop_codon:yes gene_type:complete
MDINAIKARLSQLQDSNTRVSNLWKPPAGQTQIRIVPYLHNKDNPFIELFFHYQIGSKNYLSPISNGRPDPIEEFSQKLKENGSRDDYQIGKKLEAKMRTFAPVVVRGQESEGVKFWGFGKTVYQELLSINTDPDYFDITDAMNGRDIVVEFKTAEELGTAFPKTNIRVKPNQTPITEDANLMETLLNSQKNLNEIYKEQSYEELTSVLESWISGKSDDEEGKESKEVSKPTSPAPVAETNTVSSTADTFDDLFNS